MPVAVSVKAQVKSVCVDAEPFVSTNKYGSGSIVLGTLVASGSAGLTGNTTASAAVTLGTLVASGSGTIEDALRLDFTAGLPGSVSFTRSSSASRFNSSGVLTTETTDVARIDYDPSTLANKGLLIEEQRINAVRNSSGSGAVPGTPGTLPTNWLLTVLGTLSYSVVATGTSNGIPYVDIRLSGTTSTTFTNIAFESTSQIAAANGQSWSNATFMAIVGGSITNIGSIRQRVGIYSSTPTYLGELVATPTDVKAALNGTLTRQPTTAGTISSASAAYVSPYVQLTFTSGVAIDITLRIGLPQLALGAFATSPISTSSVAVTRAADYPVQTGSNFSSWWDSAHDTIVLTGCRSPASGTRVIWQADDGTANNKIVIYTAGTSVKADVITSGVTQASLTLGTITANTAFKVALAFAANDIAGCLNGGTVQTDISATLPTVDRAKFGHDNSGNHLCGNIAVFSAYQSRKNNATLQALAA